MDAHLNEPRDTWNPWQADEEMLYGIMTGQLTPEMDEAPAVRTCEGFLIQSAA